MRAREGEAGAWALIDYPALARTCGLIETPEAVEDPFVALHDLASVIGALIFYDRVLVVEWEPIVERARRILEIDDALVGLAPDGPVRGIVGPLEPWSGERYAHGQPTPREATLTQLFWAGVGDLDRATRVGAPWMSSLRQRWEALLPGLQWPVHDTLTCVLAVDDYDEAAVNLSWSGGPFSITHDASFMFVESREYRRIERDTTRTLVVDNDMRALFHVALAQRLDAAIGAEAPATVRYVAGCLRTPLVLALSELAATSLSEVGPSAERSLQETSRSLYPGTPAAVRMPFWFEAVMATARDRPDVADRIGEYRRQGATFRRHRAEMEHAVALRDGREARRIAAALTGDTSRLTSHTQETANAALNTGDVALNLLVPLPVGLAQLRGVGSAALGSDRRSSLAIRLFHRELRVIYNLQRHASRLANSLPSAFKLFGIPHGDAREPLAFLDRLGDSIWVN